MKLNTLGPHIANVENLLLKIALAGNDRLTVNQAAFFVIASHAEAVGKPKTLSEIMLEHDAILTKSLKSTYKVLLVEGGKQYRRTALGWLKREPDPDDQRRKFLRVTEKGKSVIANLVGI